MPNYDHNDGIPYYKKVTFSPIKIFEGIDDNQHPTIDNSVLDKQDSHRANRIDSIFEELDSKNGLDDLDNSTQPTNKKRDRKLAVNRAMHCQKFVPFCYSDNITTGKECRLLGLTFICQGDKKDHKCSSCPCFLKNVEHDFNDHVDLKKH